jgi:hypothetical protein
MLTLTALAVAAVAFQNPLGTFTESTVKIDPSHVLSTLKSHGVGVGVAVWDEHMLDAEIPKIVTDGGFKVIRYPGGSYADIYQWKTHTATKGTGANVQPGKDFDSFMKMSNAAGSTPLITVNYGSNPEGTAGAEPAYAAEWVRYANKEKHYGVKFWEIGNEVYGNGFYNGQGWEEDLHAGVLKDKKDQLKNPALGPTAYGKNMNAFVTAMKAEDPTIKVGAVLTNPGFWPDAVEPDWNTNVLKECGKNIDFVVVHWYGEGKSPAEVLRSLRVIPGVVEKLKGLIAEYCRPETEIWMTEGDASGYGQRQAGALFAADHFATWLSSGADSVNWWNLHNGLSVQRDDYGDQGILSSGHKKNGVEQPDANTPFPPYYGVQMFNRMIQPGDDFIAAKGNRSTLVPHAARRKDGKISVMLINEDPDHDSVVTLEGLPLAEGERFDYQRGWTSLKRSRLTKPDREWTVRVPAYGIVVIRA